MKTNFFQLTDITDTKKTLVIVNSFPPRYGGIESFVLGMVSKFPADKVVVYTTKQTGAVEHDQQLPYPVIRDRAKYLLPTSFVANRIIKIAKKYGCDRVWFGDGTPLALISPHLRKFGVSKIVSTTHGHEMVWIKFPFLKYFLRSIAKNVDVITYLGEYCRSRISPTLRPEDCKKMRKLNPGVGEKFLSDSVDANKVRTQLGLGKRPVVVCVSRLVKRKGQDVLLNALLQVRKVIPNVVLLLVGEGKSEKYLRNKTEKLGLTDSVIFVGGVSSESLLEYYAAGNVFAMLARSRFFGFDIEGLGICYLEAAALALPVVVGNSGGTSDAVVDNYNGLLVSSKNVNSVTKALLTFLQDPDLSKSFGENGKNWIATQWTVDIQFANLKQYLEI